MPSNAFLDTLGLLELEVIQDSKGTAYVFYQNCFVQVTDKEIKVTSYDQLPGVVWEYRIIKRKFSTVEDMEKTISVFAQFLFNCMGKDQERYDSFRSILGYLLHRYKARDIVKAIVLCDEAVSDNPEGGTGKSLAMLALKAMLNIVVEDGRNFSFGGFAFQQLSSSIDLLVFDDAGPKFQFEKLFSLLTNDIPIERKYKDRYLLEFHEIPKVLITTNYVMLGEGNSYDRRRVEVEFSQHYNKQHTPIDEFGTALFDSWDEHEYNLFDNFMISCLQFFLREGIIEPDHINLDLRKILAYTCSEFVDFAQEFQPDTEHNKREAFNLFAKRYPDFSHWLRQRTFNRWLKMYASYKRFGYSQRKSNGQYFFTYHYKN